MPLKNFANFNWNWQFGSLQLIFTFFGKWLSIMYRGLSFLLDIPSASRWSRFMYFRYFFSNSSILENEFEQVNPYSCFIFRMKSCNSGISNRPLAMMMSSRGIGVFDFLDPFLSLLSFFDFFFFLFSFLSLDSISSFSFLSVFV